jgi:hypothetical protein
MPPILLCRRIMGLSRSRDLFAAIQTNMRPKVSASLLDRDHSRAQKGMRIPAGDIEALVLDRLRALLSSRTDVSETLAPLDLDAYALDAALRKALKLSER